MIGRMLADIDYQGIATVIAAVTGLITAIGVLMARKPVLNTHRLAQSTNDRVDTSNGKTIGELVEHSAAVADAALPAVKAITPDAVVPDTNTAPDPTPS